MKSCLEVVSYRLKPEADAVQFMEYANKLQETLNGVQGFKKREVFCSGDSRSWVEIVEWESPEAAKQAEAAIMQLSFMREAMGLIDQSTIQMHVVKQAI
ncbi:hypothetical protein FE783_06965 [Paenibacillus mesophilus]|uniref:hypothetical protein n=1 Tax=Paenibacillus mesophilus TaxID=2582849 RepID=UPI00110F4865|nr:hypothetical protein [Paenibacillus mesophilus]TMV51510.1 hypothetical protein FE783_06965 [Paenibacillus mesophilus]